MLPGHKLKLLEECVRRAEHRRYPSNLPDDDDARGGEERDATARRQAVTGYIDVVSFDTQSISYKYESKKKSTI